MPIRLNDAQRLAEADRSTAYLTFLSKAVQQIGVSLDYEKTLKALADSMVPELSDWCGVDILQEDGYVKRLAISHVDPKKVKKALELSEKYPPNPDAKLGTPAVIRTGEPMMANSITDEMLVASAKSEEHLELMRACDFHSMMIVAIKSQDKVLGTITMVWSSTPGNNYSLADLAFAETLAGMAGSAISNARLHSKLKNKSNKTTV